MSPGDRVRFCQTFQRLLYAHGYEHALGWWSITEVMDDTRVKVEPEGRKCAGFLVVPRVALIRSSQSAAAS